MSYNIFPVSSEKCAFGTTYAPSWEVAEQVSANGTRRAITHQLLPRWKFAVKYPMLSQAEVETIMGFYNQCKGSLIPFYWQDSYIGNEYKEEKLQYNSVLGGMQIMHKLGAFSEPCPKAVVSRVTSNGVDVTYEYHESGALCYVTYEGMGSLITAKADYKAYWLVKFASDVKITEIFKDYYSLSLTLEVVR